MTATATRTTVPLADAPALWIWARRTAIVRTALALAAAVLFGLSLAAAFALRTRATSYFASGAGMVVADMSKSIDPRAYQRTARVLQTLSTSGQRLGFIAFSDYPYELLPPGTRGDELQPLLRFFRTGSGATGFFGQPTPWSNAFLGGTDIGQALMLARHALEQDHFRSRSVLLISDLQDSGQDLPLLVDEIGTYRREHIQLRVVPLFPPTGVLAYFESIAGHGAIVSREELLRNTRVTEHRSVVGSFPWWLLACIGGLLALIAVNESACRRFQWTDA